jgi:anti-sigma factor RsiW
MTCDWVRALLPVYPEADERNAEMVRAHISNCAACRAEYEEYESLRRELAALPEFAPGVYEAIASQVRERIRRSRRTPWYWAAVAGLILAAGLGIRPAEVSELRLAIKAPEPPAVQAGFRNPVVHAAPRQRQVQKPAVAEPMEIRIVGDDPNVLIVWQVGGLPSGGGDL